MCNAAEYMTLMDEQAVNSGLSAYDWANIKSIHDAQGNIYDTDWMSEMFKDGASTQSYTLGVTGGNASSTYAVYLGCYGQEGILGGKSASNFERYNFRTNMEQKLYGDFLKVGENVSFSYFRCIGSRSCHSVFPICCR